MSQVFHEIEKKIIKALQENESLTDEKLMDATGLSPDQTRRGIEWLRLKKIIDVQESQDISVLLNTNGLDALKNGLPERQLLNLLKDGPKKINDLQKSLGSIFGPAIGLAKKNGWVKTYQDFVELDKVPNEITEEKILLYIGTGKVSVESITDKESLSSLRKRPNFILEEVSRNKTISLLPNSRDLIVSEDTGAIDVEAESPIIFAARSHPLKEIINEIKETFVSLGFSEIYGNLAQPSFWNFDALFTPQDHPAREMQDTFYLRDIKAKKFASQDQIKNVAAAHKNGWRYQWDINSARKMVLRTHTTCVTIKYLAENKPDEARVFSLGRVFRNEKVSYKHLVEFHQVEGVVIGQNSTLRDLMGIQREFYRRIGLNKVKFWPTFFPYTEPSLQTMVYNDRLNKWVELFGMGIFRPEVTKPLGITKPVLAWGGGLERIAMLKYGVDDVREFYNNDLRWLRSVTRCQ